MIHAARSNPYEESKGKKGGRVILGLPQLFGQ